MDAAFEMPPRLDAIDATVRAVRAAAAPWMDPAGADGLETAVSEALTNIVRHACHGVAEAGDVRLRLALDEAEVWLEITDGGRPGPADLYDSAPDLDAIDVMQESGRGRALVRHFARTVRYSPSPAGNRLVLTFARGPGD